MNGIASLVQRVLKDREIHAIVSLGDGSDHVAFEVNDAFIVRQQKHVGEHSAAVVDREVRVLGIVSRVSPIPVPEVVAAAPELGLIVLRKLEGRSLLEEPCRDPTAFVEQLARFLSRIHGIPVEFIGHIAGADTSSLRSFLADAAAEMPHIAALLSRDDRRLVEAFLAASPPSEPTALTFCHNDLGQEHLLASPDQSRLTGVIDWTDAAVTDPARDVGRLYRDLGPDTAERIVGKLEISADDQLLVRAAFHARCALLEDLAFGLGTGHRRYADAAIAHLKRTFQAD